MASRAWLVGMMALLLAAPAQEADLVLTDAAADRFAALALKCVRQEYPNSTLPQISRKSGAISAILPCSFSWISVRPLPTA